MSEDEKSILYVQTSGVEEPSRSATVFFLAAAAAAMDMEAGIYFTPRPSAPGWSPIWASSQLRG